MDHFQPIRNSSWGPHIQEDAVFLQSRLDYILKISLMYLLQVFQPCVSEILNPVRSTIH